MLAVSAADPSTALAQLQKAWHELIGLFEGKRSVRLPTLLSVVSSRLARIPLAREPHTVAVVSLVGEYFVRKDLFSRCDIVDYLQAHGFAVKVAPAMEYLCYSMYNMRRGLQEGVSTPLQRMVAGVKASVQQWWEWRIKSLLAASGLYRFEMIDVERTVTGVRHLVNENLRGETILTVGSAMREILDDSCGVVAIGPFGCMPSRISEAILKREMTVAGKRRMRGWERRELVVAEEESLPFLSIETDGNPFPQVIRANLEAFVLRAARLHRRQLAREADAAVPAVETKPGRVLAGG